MKEKEGLVDCPDQQVILYVEKEDGVYGPVQTGSYLTANYLDDYVQKRRNLESELREQLLRGDITPVKYYQVLVDLSIHELSARTSIRRSRVRKHLDPASFGSATVDELRRYALVFNVPVANLLQVMVLRNNEVYESALILENRSEKISVFHDQPANPFLVVTRIEERV